MAYEVEAFTPTTTPVDASVANSASIMREDRVIEPYRQSSLKAVPENVQPITNDTSAQAKPEEPAKPAEATVALSPQMAALARREQAFRRQQQELKTQQQALEADRAKIAEYEALKAKLSSKDFSEIEKLVPYNEYAQYLIDKGAQETPEQAALKKLEAEVQGMKEAQKSDIDKQFEAAVAQRKAAVTELVASSNEFPGIKKLKQEDAVVQHILDTWEHDDIELSPEQAAKEVEQIMKERAQAWASILESEVKPPVEQKQPLPPMRQGTRTLTNEMTIQGEVKTPRKSFQGLSDAERWAEARRRAEERLERQKRG